MKSVLLDERKDERTSLLSGHLPSSNSSRWASSVPSASRLSTSKSLQHPSNDFDDVSIPRGSLLRALVYRSRRFYQCRSLPLSVLSYAAFISTLLLHAKVSIAYDFEFAMKETFVEDTGFLELGGSAEAWFPWVHDSYLPRVLPMASGSYDWELRPLNQYTVVVGGVRFAQARSVAAACSEDSGLQSLYRESCYPSLQLSTAPFGRSPNISVQRAFVGNSSRGEEGRASLPYAFELILDAEIPVASGMATVNDLASAGWLDAASRSLVATLVLYNGQISYWGGVRLVMDVQRGGRLLYSAHISSFPADPYAPSPDVVAEATDGSGGTDGSDVSTSTLVFLDCFIALYTFYLLVGTCRRVGKRISFSRARMVGINAFSNLAFCSKLATSLLCDLWLVLDYASITSLLTTFYMWFLFVAEAGAIRKEFTADSVLARSSAGPSAALFASRSYSDVAARVQSATMSWESVKTASVISLIALSLRLFKYFQFQPRLAVMTNALGLAFSDGAHFIFLFGIFLLCYGTWAMFMFGTQAPAWSSTSTSFISLLRFLMYDYDLEAMQNSYPRMADFFFVTFMVIMTNCMLWMFFGIILDSYNTAREASHGAPSLWDDACVTLRSMPPLRSLIWYLSRGYYGTPFAGVDDVIAVLQRGPLAQEGVVESGEAELSAAGSLRLNKSRDPSGMGANRSITQGALEANDSQVKDIVTPYLLARNVSDLSIEAARDLIMDSMAWNLSALGDNRAVPPLAALPTIGQVVSSEGGRRQHGEMEEGEEEVDTVSTLRRTYAFHRNAIASGGNAAS